MFAIQEVFQGRYPLFYKQHPIASKSVILLLQKIWRESEFQAFAAEHKNLKGVELIDAGFKYLGIKLAASEQALKRIPTTGSLIIVSNHPTGTIDGVGLLSLVHKIRKDVKLIQGSILRNTLGMHDLSIEVDNLSGAITPQAYREVKAHLEQGGAIIMFPAGEVSRPVEGQIQDKSWESGFYRFAKATGASIVPVYIKGKNSSFFYFLGRIWKPLSMLWVVPEVFSHKNKTLPLYIGDVLEEKYISEKLSRGLNPREIVKAIRQKCLELGAMAK